MAPLCDDEFTFLDPFHNDLSGTVWEEKCASGAIVNVLRKYNESCHDCIVIHDDGSWDYSLISNHWFFNSYVKRIA